ncbi:MAG: hypothetical protein IPH20_26230 [Bacteroidales bacterium]|nr:hypothetical protein [Bacteroidales bacterium]
MTNRLLFSFAWLIILILFSHNSVAQVNLSVTDSLTLRFDNMKEFTKKGCRLTGGTLSLKMKNTSDQDQLIRYVEANEPTILPSGADGAYAFADQTLGAGPDVWAVEKTGLCQNSDGEIFSGRLLATSIPSIRF